MKKEKLIIAGNWKMNKTPSEAKRLITDMVPALNNPRCETILFVPYMDIRDSIALLRNTKVKIGAQNFHWKSSGAYTGEISIEMLEDEGVKILLAGHSERKMYFGETDETINYKVKKAISSNIGGVILCVGESLEQRESKEEKETVMSQIKAALDGVPRVSLYKVYIAYEPIWSIGTGKTATADQANKMCMFIKMCIQNIYGMEAGAEFKVMYGGSVNSGNCRDILSMPDIDGVLVGGASINPDEFSYIINVADDILK